MKKLSWKNNDVLFMVTDLCGKHVKSSMIKIIIEFRVVVTPGEGNGWGRHTESLNKYL